jgi:hypothetical protein
MKIFFSMLPKLLLPFVTIGLLQILQWLGDNFGSHQRSITPDNFHNLLLYALIFIVIFFFQEEIKILISRIKKLPLGIEMAKQKGKDEVAAQILPSLNDKENPKITSKNTYATNPSAKTNNDENKTSSTSNDVSCNAGSNTKNSSSEPIEPHIFYIIWDIDGALSCANFSQGTKSYVQERIQQVAWHFKQAKLDSRNAGDILYRRIIQLYFELFDATEIQWSTNREWKTAVIQEIAALRVKLHENVDKTWNGKWQSWAYQGWPERLPST